MKILTKKHREYLEKLKQRNAQLIKEHKPGSDKAWYQGLSRPMTSAERKNRSRIRKNAIAAMFDLVLVGNAGVLPNRGLKKEGVTGVPGMVASIQNHMLLQMVTGEVSRKEGRL